MLTTGHTKIDAVLTTYRTILAETIDTLAGAQGEVAALTADLAAARASLEAAQKAPASTKNVAEIGRACHACQGRGSVWNDTQHGEIVCKVCHGTRVEPS
jgi:excinuclease UvrABC ATPase subunit